MSRTTPAEKRANRPQPILRSLPQQQEIAVNIVTHTSGEDLAKVLQGVSAFTNSFDAADQYEVTIRVEKLPKEVEDNGNAATQG